MKKCELRNRAVLCINGNFAPDFVVRCILVRFQIVVTREYSNLQPLRFQNKLCGSNDIVLLSTLLKVHLHAVKGCLLNILHDHYCIKMTPALQKLLRTAKSRQIA
jgi:hypothetical protein